MGVHFSLNYRKPKKEYKPSDELMVLVRYYFKGDMDKKGKKLNLSTGVKCKLSDWNLNWNKTIKKEPIKKSDPQHKEKNILIKQFEQKINNIVLNIEKEWEQPLTTIVKSKIKQIKIKKREKSYKDVHFLYMFQKYEDYVIDELPHSYRKTLLTQIKYIKEYCNDYQNKHNLTLLTDDIDEEFIRKFVKWCYFNQNIQPSTLGKRIRGFVHFGKWSNRVHKTNYNITTPPNLIKTNKSKVIYLTRDEVKKLYEFNEFNISNPNHSKVFSKHPQTLTYIKDIRTSIKSVKDREKTYTNYEVVKDMLVFLCSTGMRYGDLCNIRIDNFRYYQDNKGKEDRTKGMWEFRMEKVPRKGEVNVPSNFMSFQIYKKYSDGKKRVDYLFPRTVNGNPMSNQKFNKHVKTVCEIIGLKRLVRKPKFTLDGKVMSGTDIGVPLFEIISSHIGRRTFIREQIEIGRNLREIMSMSGHSSVRVFNGYYDVNPSDLWKKNDELFGFDLSENKKKTKTSNGVIDTQIENQLTVLKKLYDKGLMSEEQWNKKVGEILNP